MPVQPVGEAERYRPIDAIRGAALFGVLLINLLDMFRVSLFEHMLHFHTDPGALNHAVDLLATAFVEFKALTLFSFLFGVGAAIQAERCVARGRAPVPFLLRRFLVLLAFGLAHMFLIWNGDILTLYAVCGLLLAGTIRLPARVLAVLGVAAILLPSFVALPISFAGEAAIRAQAIANARVYGHAGYFEIVAFRWPETWRFLAPIMVSVLPRTAGLFWCGAAAWRANLFVHAEKRRAALWMVALGGGVIGGGAALAEAMARSAGRPSPVPGMLSDVLGIIPLAFAYAAAMLLWLRPGRGRALAAVGQMALTNYLTQSIVLGFVFYGYGLGWYGGVDPAAGLAMACALYAVQLAASVAWLARYRFGPFEWAWRSLTYGRLQPFARPQN